MKTSSPKSRLKSLPVEEQIRLARNVATETVLALLFTVLVDKEGADTEICKRVWDEMNDLAKSITAGLVTVKDMAKTLRLEYGIDITGGRLN